MLVLPPNKALKSDKMPATREVEQGHECLSWVVNRLSKMHCQRLFSPKETLKYLEWVAIFGHERSLR